MHILKHQGTHFPKAHDIDRLVFQIPEGLLHLFHGKKRDIARKLAQVGFGLDALGGVNGLLKELVQDNSRAVKLVGRLVGTTNLVQNLVFAHGHAVQARTHVHHVPCHVIAFLVVEIRCVTAVILVNQATHILYQVAFAKRSVTCHVNFGAVAGGKNQ